MISLRLPSGSMKNKKNGPRVEISSVVQLFEIQTQVFGLAIFEIDGFQISEGVTNCLITSTFITIG